MSPYLLKTLGYAPNVLEKLIRSVPVERFDEALGPDRFTLRHAIAHWSDWEPIFQERIRLVLSEENATIVVYDEGQRAIDLSYDDWDVFESIEKLKTARAHTASMVAAIPMELFRKPFIHPEAGPLVLEDLIQMIQGHDMYHLEQVSQYV